uniref:Secreted protein n=1 Tax=Trichogramma kaykai TaxID=54128 RepID=A0ABD2WDZ2_9HYME
MYRGTTGRRHDAREYAAAAASLVTCAAQLLYVIKLTTKCVKTPVVCARGCYIVSVHSAKESFERSLRYRCSREYLLFDSFLCSHRYSYWCVKQIRK